MIRVLLSKSTCSIMKFANRVIVSANRKCTWNSREIRTWKRVVLMGKRLKIIYIKILWGGKYNKYIIKFVLWDCFWIFLLSKPIRLRGLKLDGAGHGILPAGSKPIRLRGLKFLCRSKNMMNLRRSLYGFVDWNIVDGMLSCNAVVEAYTASWIEIRNVTAYLRKTTSKPIRLRGLKSPNSLPLPCGLCRSLYGFVDWNQAPPSASNMAQLSKPIRLRGLKLVFRWNL